jgi:hypothetical protein
MTPDAAPIRRRAHVRRPVLLTLSTLTYQLLLTRTFSVTMGSVVARTAMVVSANGDMAACMHEFLEQKLVGRDDG